MNIYIIGLFIVGGFISFGLLAMIYFNFFKARKNGGNPTNRLKYGTAAYLCIAGAFAYFVYWLVNGDWFRAALGPALLIHALLLFLLVFVASKHAHKSENLPGVIRMSLVTFSIVHLTLPSFVPGYSYALFKFIQDPAVVTISFMIAIFLAVVNLILMIVMLVMFFKVRRD